LRDSHSDKRIFLSLFSSETILKIPAEKLYGIISFDSYAIVYMQKREKVSTLRGFVASKNMWHRYDKNEKQNNPLIEQSD